MADMRQSNPVYTTLRASCANKPGRCVDETVYAIRAAATAAGRRTSGDAKGSHFPRLTQKMQGSDTYENTGTSRCQVPRLYTFWGFGVRCCIGAREPGMRICLTQTHPNRGRDLVSEDSGTPKATNTQAGLGCLTRWSIDQTHSARHPLHGSNLEPFNHGCTWESTVVGVAVVRQSAFHRRCASNEYTVLD